MTSVDTIKKNLEDNRSKVYKKDYNFFDLGFVLRLAKASQEQSCDCKRCQANMERLEQFSGTYPELIAMGHDGKQQLEDGMDEIFDHLRHQHGYSRKEWYKSLYSMYGFGAGILLGSLAAWMAPEGSGKMAFLSVAMVMLLAGYIWGSRKDSLSAKNGKTV